MEIAALIGELYSQWPKLHGEEGQNQWSLPASVLEWITRHVRSGDHTLETGCGYSTLVFAASGCVHTVISPVAAEHARIREWGERRGIDFSKVTFIAAKSEDVLPSLKTPPLDLVLIDGWHAFPGPFLDWFFLSRLVAINGVVIVDDVQLRACRMLRDFLRAEQGRWRLEACVGRSEMFRKLTNELFVGDWDTQPYGAVPYRTPREWVQHAVARPIINALKRVPGVHAVARSIRSAVQR